MTEISRERAISVMNPGNQRYETQIILKMARRPREWCCWQWGRGERAQRAVASHECIALRPQTTEDPLEIKIIGGIESPKAIWAMQGINQVRSFVQMLSQRYKTNVLY